MANEKRLIDANALMDAFRSYMAERYDEEKCVSEENCKTCEKSCLWRKIVSAAPTVDAVKVAQIKEFMQNILETLDNLIAVDEPLANDTAPSSSYYRGKVNAYEVARRLVNAAMTDLCDHCGAKMDGGNGDV